MNTNHTFDDVWEELKASGNEEKEFFETAEEIARIINEITETRIRKGYSQRQLAEKCGLKQSAIARMETLQSVPRLDTLVKIGNSLGIKFSVSPEITIKTGLFFELGQSSTRNYTPWEPKSNTVRCYAACYS